MQVYPPQEDSHLLETEILKINLENKKCLDMGTGSGIQANAMLKAGSKEIICVDINYKALLASEKRNHEFKNNIRFIESNLFSSLKDEVFDFIAFNPPYLPSDDMKFKDLDGGKKGREITDKFIKELPNHMHQKSICYLLISSLNDEEELLKFLEKNGLIGFSINRLKLFFEELIVLKIAKV